MDRAPSSLLVEPGAPPWGQRLGLRLGQQFVSKYPTAPMRLWSVDTPADLPPADEWTGAVVSMPDGSVWASNGVAWIKVGPGAGSVGPPGPQGPAGPAGPQGPAGPVATTAVLAPQFDNSTLIASTAWVQRRGLQSSGYYSLNANTVLTAAHAGAQIQVAADNLTVTLPGGSAVPGGTQIWLWTSNSKAKIQAAAGDFIFTGPTGVTSLTLEKGDALVLTNYGGGWVTVAGATYFRGAMVGLSADQPNLNFVPYPTYVSFGVASYDTSGFWSAGQPTRLTIPQGVSLVKLAAGICASNIADNFCDFAIHKNGVTSPSPGYPGIPFIRQRAMSGNFPDAFLNITSGIIPVIPGDYFQVHFRFLADTLVDLYQAYTWFSLEVVR